jgi:hypothetical protein
VGDLKDVFEFIYSSHSPDKGLSNPAGLIHYTHIQYAVSYVVMILTFFI